MAEKTLLKDQLFNAQTVEQLASEYSKALPDFDPLRFQREALSGFPERELMARMEWLADCISTQLSNDFNVLADELEAAMPPPLSSEKTDDDFGHFIHAIPGILAARHGLTTHRARAMQLLYRATQRFSMEFYIRPFLIHWPDETLAELYRWADDDHYHVRRLVSEGTRPKLPWAKAVDLSPEQTFPLLDKLHGDPTRYVTRSVANHLNDLSKAVPDQVISKLDHWREGDAQAGKELDWMTRHALRTLVKSGHGGALNLLGYKSDLPLDVSLNIRTPIVKIGEALAFSCSISSLSPVKLLVDYRIEFARPNGRIGKKIFKLKQSRAAPNAPLEVRKEHLLKADATTFKWHAGAHKLVLQVNGADRASAVFEVS